MPDPLSPSAPLNYDIRQLSSTTSSLIIEISRLSQDIGSGYYFQQALHSAKPLFKDPSDAIKEVEYQKAVFSNLKSQYMHLSHRTIFLTKLLAFPPAFATQDDVLRLDANVQHAAERKKTAKAALDDATKDVEELLRGVHAAYEGLTTQMHTLLSSSRALAVLQREVDGCTSRDVEADADADADGMTRDSAHVERALREEEARVVAMRAAVDAARAEIAAVDATRADMRAKLAALVPQRAAAERAAAAAVRDAQMQDKSIEELSSWYKSCTGVLMTLLGLVSVQHTSTTCMALQFVVADAPVQTATLQISVGTDIVDAAFLDLDVPLASTIRECRHYCGSRRLDDLMPRLIRHAVERARRHVAKMRELTALQKAWTCEHDGTGSVVHGVAQSGTPWRIVVSPDYPAGPTGGLTLAVCGDMDVAPVHTTMSAMRIRTLSQLVPALITGALTV
ncbi:hypothetical protein SeMB42_g06507 [Synchytrium endobioticum]|nr:hypothetical protein SeMB42_g06507 [Synchytrium endobioticum]